MQAWYSFDWFFFYVLDCFMWTFSSFVFPHFCPVLTFDVINETFKAITRMGSIQPFHKHQVWFYRTISQQFFGSTILIRYRWHLLPAAILVCFYFSSFACSYVKVWVLIVFWCLSMDLGSLLSSYTSFFTFFYL